MTTFVVWGWGAQTGNALQRSVCVCASARPVWREAADAPPVWREAADAPWANPGLGAYFCCCFFCCCPDLGLCLAFVSVLSRFCLARVGVVSGLSRFCLSFVSVLSRFCLRFVFVFSRCCLGVCGTTLWKHTVKTRCGNTLWKHTVKTHIVETHCGNAL